jgi:hypothetical protein
LAIAGAARAGVPCVAIVTDHPDDGLPALMHAELDVLGYEVILVGSKESTASETSGSLAARLVPSHNGVEVWIVDPETSTLTLRELVRVAAASPSSHRIAAVRAVEVIRARLAAPRDQSEVQPESPPPKADASPAIKDAASTDSVKPRRGGFDFFLGPALLASPGSLSANWEASLEVRWMPGDHVAIGLLGMFPLSSGRLEASEGAATLSATLVGATIDWLPSDSRRKLRPQVGVALAGVRLGMNGIAQPPFLDRAEQIFVALPSLRAGLAVELAPRLALRIEGLAGASLPRATIRFAGREVADWGRPLLSLSGGIEASFP